MSHGLDDPQLNYDEFDKGPSSEEPCVGSFFIQIDLPSTRIEVAPSCILFKDTGLAVQAKDIKQEDLLTVMRHNIQATEGVLDVRKVFKYIKPESNRNGDIIIVNNVPMRPKSLKRVAEADSRTTKN